MTSKSESRTSKALPGLIREPIPASLFTAGIVLTFGYVTGLIFTIGDIRQLTSVLAGIIIGSIVFSLVGFLLKPSRLNGLVLTILSVALLISAYVIISLNSLVLDGTNMMIVTFLMISPAMAVSQLVGRLAPDFSVTVRLVFGSVQAILVIVFIIVYALEYEMGGQVNLYLGPLIFLLLSLVYLTVDKLL